MIMDQGLIPRRYAKALFLAASEKGAEKQLYIEMGSLCAAFDRESDLTKTMANPFVSQADKSRLIISAAQTTAAKSPMLADFLTLLGRNRRIDLIRAIALAYRDIYRKANHIYRVEVVAASAPSAENENRLKEFILKELNGGQMEYSLRIDPDLIGGFVVNIDNERLDASIKNELKQLRFKLLSQR